jgi:hypothetical protein
MKKRPQVSRTRVYFHVPMTSGFASRDRSMWQTVHVSSSTSKFDLLKSNEEATAGLENTFSNAKTHRQIIAVCISSGTPPATLDVTSTETYGRNFIQIIIWISLCSVTASPCQFERLSCQFERSREHVCMYTSQWHLASHLERNAARYSRCDKQSLSVRAVSLSVRV